MKKGICFLLMVLITLSICACTEQEVTEAESGADLTSTADMESSEEVVSDESGGTDRRIYAVPATIRRYFDVLNIQYTDDGLTLLTGDEITSSCTWDELGRITWAQSNWTGIQCVYEYDADGKLMVERQKNRDGGETARIEYMYDEQGRCTVSTTIINPGVTGGWHEYTYHADGTLATEIQYSGQGLEAVRFAYQYDANGNVVQRIRTVNNDVECFTYEYDTRGNMVKETCSYFDGTVAYEKLYEYDENGLCLKASRVNPGEPARVEAELAGTAEVALTKAQYETVLRMLFKRY